MRFRTPSRVVTAAEREDNYENPEKVFLGLTRPPPEGHLHRLPNEILDANPELNRYKDRAHYEEIELCYVCGWTAANEVFAHYQSQVRVEYVRDNVAIWQLGKNWLVRDQANNASLGNDYMTQEFLRSQRSLGLNIPMIEEMRRLSGPDDKVHILLMSRVPGDTLRSVWDSLSLEEKTEYANQLREALKQIRQYTKPTAQKVDGTVLDDNLFQCTGAPHCATACKQVGRENDEWLENMKAELIYGLSSEYSTVDMDVLEEKYQELKRNFPKSEPYVLSHTDLNLSNIIVKDNKIQAIIDWEFAGYYPWWYERMRGNHNDKDHRELAGLVWNNKELDGMTEDDFWAEVGDHLSPLLSAFDSGCRHNSKHNVEGRAWYRPKWCECQPLAGKFSEHQYDSSFKLKHELWEKVEVRKW